MKSSICCIIISCITKGGSFMDLSQNFQFRYEEYSTFGARLKKWRELNNISQTEMAEAIYNYRKYLGLEDDDVTKEVLKEEYVGDEKYKPIDYEIDAKR